MIDLTVVWVGLCDWIGGAGAKFRGHQNARDAHPHAWLEEQEQRWLELRIRELQVGKLACECPPGVPCHGDVLAAEVVALAGGGDETRNTPPP